MGGREKGQRLILCTRRVRRRDFAEEDAICGVVALVKYRRWWPPNNNTHHIDEYMQRTNVNGPDRDLWSWDDKFPGTRAIYKYFSSIIINISAWARY